MAVSRTSASGEEFMDSTASPRDATDYRDLPERVRPAGTITSQEISDAPDPATGRDTETEWLLRNAAG